jgi:hypothetical protein
MKTSVEVNDVFVTYTSFGSIFAFVSVAILCLVGYTEHYFDNFYYDKVVHFFAGVLLTFLCPLLITIFSFGRFVFDHRVGGSKFLDGGAFLYPKIETIRFFSFLTVLLVSVFWEFLEGWYPNLLMQFLPIPYVSVDSGIESAFDILFGMLGWCGVNKFFFERN